MIFRNGRSLKDYLVRTALPKMANTGGAKPGEIDACQVCDHVIRTSTFTTKACGKSFKIHSGSLNYNSEKVLYLLRYGICDDTPYVGKAKTKFRLRFDNYKSKHQSFQKGKQNVPQKRFYLQDCHKSVDDWKVTLFEKCQTHKQLKERETFWQRKLKTFYPLGLNEKAEFFFSITHSTSF